jgi:transcriptional regulator with XRE-family HTH domain
LEACAVPTQTADDFARRLRDALKARSMSQARLAEAVGVSENTVSSWTCGRHQPDFPHLRLIARALELSVDALLGPAESDEGQAQLARASGTAGAHDLIARLAALKLEATLGDLAAAVSDLIGIIREAQAQVQGRTRDRTVPR